MECSECAGAGRIEGQLCPTCDGAATVRVPRAGPAPARGAAAGWVVSGITLIGGLVGGMAAGHVGPFASSASVVSQSAAQPATVAVAPLDCTFRVTATDGTSVIWRLQVAEASAFQWSNTTTNYPKTCDGIRLSYQNQQDVAVVTFTTTPTAPPLCEHNGWSAYPDAGDVVSARSSCVILTGQAPTSTP